MNFTKVTVLLLTLATEMRVMAYSLFRNRVSRQISLTSLRSSSSSVSVNEHATFLTDVAKVTPPKRLDTLLEVLQLKGEELVSPRKRAGINPLLIPLSYSPSDKSYTCFLRWPTQKEDMELQVIKTTEVGVQLLALSTDKFCHRELIEGDFYAVKHLERLAEIVNKDGKVYELGDYMTFLKSGKFPSITPEDLRLLLDRYVLSKAGSFPDCLERIAMNFLKQKNEVSALITCERGVTVFYGWGSPIGFHALQLDKLKRDSEARDTARSSMQMPKWTLANNNKDLDRIIKLAGFSERKIVGDMHAFRANDPRTKDIEEGFSKEQILLDQAAHLMDAVALGSVEGGWDAIRSDLGQRYRDGGYPDMAVFIETIN